MENLLFSPYKLGQITLKNRIVMAPMTRSRAIDNIPNEMMAEYYAQRASAGLLITEGTSPSPNGLGYSRIPGLFSERQVNGWKKVTDAVHQKGGKIFVQLMHTGRVSHPLNMPENTKIIAPSAIVFKGEVWTDQKQMQPYPIPEEMTYDEIQSTINEYVGSAKLAIEAGFDGVELHGANGYLIEQFINPAANQRTDEYGGTIEKRLRFVIEIAEKAAAAIGADRLGIRVSPYGVSNGMSLYDEIEEAYSILAKKLSEIGLVYLHIADHSSMGAPEVKPSVKIKIRENFKGCLILSGGYDAVKAEQEIKESNGDLVAFGRYFISNPDLVNKLKLGLQLREADKETLYSGGAKGYIDYPMN
ncbi:MAG: alkene reductase [Ignavibacteriaceae bacterium]